MVRVVRNNIPVEIPQEEHLRELLDNALPSDTLMELLNKDAQKAIDLANEVAQRELDYDNAVQSAKDIIQGVNQFSNSPQAGFTTSFSTLPTAGMTNSEIVAYVTTIGQQLLITQQVLTAVVSAIDIFGNNNLKRVLVEINKQFQEQE